MRGNLVVLAGTTRALRRAPTCRLHGPNSYRHAQKTYTLYIQMPSMDLARGTYSSARVLVGACLAPFGSRTDKRVLENGYGLWFSTEIYGSKQEKTDFHENLQEHRLFLQKSAKVSRNLRKCAGERNLGILHSSSLL